jgi:Xaa-Pro aminopeptidase
VTLADRRRGAYEDLLRRASADVAVLSSPEAVQHATGVRLYTTELIPERPVVAVVSGGGTALVCWEWEHAQVEAEHPGLPLVGYPEFGGDPWGTAAATAVRLAGSRPHALVESTAPWALVEALERHNAAVARDDALSLLEPRIRKDPDEIAILAGASRAADTALAATERWLTPDTSEREAARRIWESFVLAGQGGAEGGGICAGPGHNLENHHLSAAAPIGRGPTRVGLKARIDGYWVLLTRMGVPADGPVDDAFDADYRGYVDAFLAGQDRIRPGTSAGEVYATVRDQLAASSLCIRSQKVGHGCGLSFREPPILRADDPTLLVAGTVLAFDFAIRPESTRAGWFIHVEDRVLVTDGLPVRLSDVTDIRRPYRFAGAAGGPQ